MRRSLNFCLRNAVGSEVLYIGFDSSEYYSQSARNQNCINSHWVVLWCRPALNLSKDVFSIRICPLAPGDHIMSQNLLVDVGVYTSIGVNPLDLPLIPHVSLLSVFSPKRQAHTNV